MITEEKYLEGMNLINEFKSFIDSIDGKTFTEDYYKVNYYKLPVTIFNMKNGTLNQSNINKLNEFISRIKNSESFTKLRRTKSGGISIEGAYLHSHPFQYDINSSTSKHIVTIVTAEGCFKLYVGYAKDRKEKKSGATPSKRLLDKCAQYEIDMEKYQNSYEDGLLAYKMIHKPEVGLVDGEIDKIYEGNIHHLDFHKFYPSGIAILHPEFKAPFIDLVANGDKEALDIGTRYLSSKYANYSYAKLIKDGINFMYQRFFQVYEDLKKDHLVLAFNTDGIWYKGEVYHNSDLYEGEGLGCWSNDYVNVQKIRFKSVGLGAYEFITEDGTYEPRYKGYSSYEQEVPRNQWKWGDIYKGSEVSISYDTETQQFTVKGVK